MSEQPSKELQDDRRRKALELLHDFKEAPLKEKARARQRLFDYLDALVEGTTSTRLDLLECLARDYYPDFRAQKLRSKQ